MLQFIIPFMPWIGIPLVALAAMKLIFGEETAKQIQKNKKTILLTGQSEAGKDTVIRALKGEEFIDSYNATPSREEDIEINLDNIYYTIINISGNKQLNAQKENIKKELKRLKQSDTSRDIVYIYVFDVLKFKSQNRQIQAEINNAVREAEEGGFRAKIIGTRGDKISLDKKQNLTNQIRQKGADAEIFDMTKATQSQIFSFLLKGAK